MNELLVNIRDTIKIGLTDTLKEFGSHFISQREAESENVNKKFDQLKQESNTHLTSIKNSMNNEIKDIKNTQHKGILELKEELNKLRNLNNTENEQNSFSKVIGTIKSDVLPEFEKQLLKKWDTRLQSFESILKKKMEEIPGKNGSIQADIKHLASELNETKTRLKNTVTELDKAIEKTNQSNYLIQTLRDELTKVQKDVANQEYRSKGLEPVISSIMRCNQQGISDEDLEKARTIANEKHISEVDNAIKVLTVNVNELQGKFKFEFQDLKRKIDNISTTSKLSLNKNKIMTTNNIENNMSASDSPLKRPRITNSSSTDSFDTNDEPTTTTLQRDFKQLDIKLQELTNYIHKFNNTVLHPSFPDSLESHVEDIQSVLENHHHMLSFLIDPIDSSKNDNRNSSTKQNGSSEKQDDEQLPEVSPAMINAIKSMVDYQTKLQIDPLKARIKELEQQLKDSN
ncbi:unnamed protein product [Cunninghamella blakesleeana]